MFFPMRFVLCTVFLSVLAVVPSAQAFAAETEELVKVVVLTRHGVRSPTQSAQELARWSTKKWPAWPVEAGKLTPRGAQLVEAMWHEQRAFFTQEKLLPENVCPPAADLFVLADRDERTRATASALLQGLAPGCGLNFTTDATALLAAEQISMHGSSDFDADTKFVAGKSEQDVKSERNALFHPLKAGLTTLSPAAARADISRESPGGLYAIEDDLAQPIREISELLGTLNSELCQQALRNDSCTLLDLPTQMRFGAQDTTIDVTGRLGIASSVAEIFLLEYAQWPDRNAGWGVVNEQVLQKLLPVHSRTFAAVNRAHEVALSRGGVLLRAMSAAVNGQSPDAAINRAPLVFFVGHDTNIANVASLLGLRWELGGYPPDAIPPGSALVLTVWKNGEHSCVRASYWTESLASLHRALPASPGFTQARVESQILHFERARLDEGHCSLEEFNRLVYETLL